MSDQGTAREVELTSGWQHVDHGPGYQQGSGPFRSEGVGNHVLSVDDCHRASADDLESAALVDDCGGIFVDSKAEQ